METLKGLDYRYSVKFLLHGRAFGPVQAFKTSWEIDAFLKANPKITMPWKKEIGEYIDELKIKLAKIKPTELDVMEEFKEKGYKYVVQFEEEKGKPFGEPLAFKYCNEPASIMRDNPNMKMTWKKKD